MTDMVNHPPHHLVGGIETIDVIEAKGLGFLAGNVIKYVLRYQFKGKPLEDLKKAQWYLNRLVTNTEAEDGEGGAKRIPYSADGDNARDT